MANDIISQLHLTSQKPNYSYRDISDAIDLLAEWQEDLKTKTKLTLQSNKVSINVSYMIKKHLITAFIFKRTLFFSLFCTNGRNKFCKYELVFKKNYDEKA